MMTLRRLDLSRTLWMARVREWKRKISDLQDEHARLEAECEAMRDYLAYAAHDQTWRSS